MAFGDVVGELFGFSEKTWIMEVEEKNAELAGKKFKGKFIPQQMQETVGSFLGENSTVNKDTPNFQWIRGEADQFSFTGRLYARDSLTSIRQDVELLKSLAKRDKTLRRAPKIRFFAGTDIAFICFIKGIQFQYDEPRSDGSLRGVTMRFQLQKLDKKLQTAKASSDLAKNLKLSAGLLAGFAGIANVTGLIDIPGGSLKTIGRTRIAKSGETFEIIANQEYGDALLGDILRRAQPQIGDLTPGDKVILIDPGEITSIRVTQQSVSLKNTQENLNLRQLKLDARNRPTTIFI